MRFTPEHLDKVPYHDGPLNAKVVIIGEAPGTHEKTDAQKRPFIGPSGRLLRSILKQKGIDPKSCYITNILKENPPGNKFDKFVRENPGILKTHLQLLSAELSLLSNANLFVPVGKRALRAICDMRGDPASIIDDRKGGMKITNWRGSVIKAELKAIKGRKCIPIIHPAAILRNWLFLPPTQCDIERIAHDLHFPEFRLPKRTYNTNPTFEEALEFLQMLIESDEKVSVDIETFRKNLRIDISPEITKEAKLVIGIDSIQVCNNATEAMCILLRHANGSSAYPVEQEMILWQKISELLTTKDHLNQPKLIGQNFSQYDVYVLGRNGINLKKMIDNIFFDLREGFNYLAPQLSAALDFTTSIYTREPFYKEEGKDRSTKQGELEFQIYGCKDVLIPWEIAPQVIKELKEQGKWQFYIERYRNMAWRRACMTWDGLRYDEDKRKELLAKNSKEILKWTAKLIVLIGRYINVKSTKQMQDLFYKDMKLPVQRNRSTGRPTVDEDAILTLASKHESEVFDIILQIRHHRTERSNYLKVVTDSDGKSRSTYGFTETGRFTSSKNPLGSGYNHQNWPYMMRELLTADSDKFVLMEMDLSQAEARVVHYAANNERMIKAFSEGMDVHRMTAADIFQVPIDKVPLKDKTPDGKATMRYTGKRTNHAGNYGMMGEKFAKVYNKDAAENNTPLISTAEGDVWIRRFHVANPEIESVYQARIIAALRNGRKLTNPWGRSMTFLDRMNQDLFRAGFAWYAQSTIGDLTNLIFDEIADDLHVKNQGHDSLILQVRNDPSAIKETAQHLYEASLKFPIKFKENTLVVPVEFKYGFRWFGMKDYEL